MFLHNFKYTLKTLFRNKSLIFWTFAFPLIMATFFNMAFKNVIEEDKLKIIDIAIIDNDEFNNNMMYKETFKTLSDKNNPDRLFNTKYVSLTKAKKLLDEEKIIGYLELKDNTPKLTFVSNGINETIFKYVVDEIHDNYSIMATSSSYVYENVNDFLESNDIKIENKANSNLDYMMIEYYTLIAMTCLYAGSIGMVAINKSLPYLKGNGKRVSVSPTKKSSIVFSSLLASYIVQVLILGSLFIYTTLVLNINYGDKIGHILLLSFIGTLSGVALGLAVGACLKANDNAKTGIMIAITMLGCFLAGMMGVGMKYVIDKNLPILNKINPANMITDGLYSLYYYSDYTRYWFNVGSLLVFTAILVIIACTKLGRARYDSI